MNSIANDQSYVNGRDIFENVSRIVDELFNDYIVVGDSVEPYFAAYCDGRELRCQGLEQWGTVALAENGLTPFEILQRYYGDDIRIVSNAPVGDRRETWDGRTLGFGDIGNSVRQIQIRLNRISKNYSGIPKVPIANGIFDQATENAVREFQRAFDLEPDGLVGKSTWYSIQRIYSAVKRLNDLASEGVTLSDASNLFNSFLSEGDTGSEVFELQYLLALIAEFNNEIPPISVDGIFGSSTRQALEAFQRIYGLNVTGEVNIEDWDRLYREYIGILTSLPAGYFGSTTIPYQGRVLRIGLEGDDVKALQEYLNFISNTYTRIPKVEADGVFGGQTQAAVTIFKEIFGLDPTPIVSASVWNEITSVYRDLYDGQLASAGQNPGFNIG